MNPTYPIVRNQAERTIAVARIVLAVSSLFAIWVDPAEPARYASLTYSLHVGYVAYSLGIGLLVWARPAHGRFSVLTHGADIVAFSVFQYLTLGPSSPFFVYFVFSLFCGAIRWGWQGTLGTAALVGFAYVIMGGSMSRTLGPSEFELNRFIVRIVYLVVTAGLLVYLGLHESRLRGEIERLARWPSVVGSDRATVIAKATSHAAAILGAGRVVVVWSEGEEPAVHMACWAPEKSSLTRHAPDHLQSLVAPDLEDAIFLCAGPVKNPATVLVSGDEGALTQWSGVAMDPALLPHLDGVGLASSPLKTDRISGRVFFGHLGPLTTELVPLTEVVAHELAASLDQLHVTQQLGAIAASEERIRLARDLHDGVLQSLTGVRLEIRAVASQDDATSSSRDRLLALERALAIEQRELRLFIDGLSATASTPRSQGTLVQQLELLRERIALEWKASVTVRIARDPSPLPPAVEQAIPLMVHEAVVNALKHAQPSRVTVDVGGGPGELRIVVSDDGHGFPFRGRYDHGELALRNDGPRSLLDRVVSLGGRMSIESTDTGSRVEMRLSI